MTPTTDLELIERFRKGDVTGFNELVRRYREKVYWIARRVLGSHEDADDVVQEVFIRVYDGIKNFRGDANFYTWLYRIAMNLSLNAVRKRRIKDFLPYDEVMEETLPGDSMADEPVQGQEYRTILERAIASLPPQQQKVFLMRYYEEMPYEAMSKLLGKTEGGLKANYFHALKKIQEFVRREMK